jgi:hypothetical protein
MDMTSGIILSYTRVYLSSPVWKVGCFFVFMRNWEGSSKSGVAETFIFNLDSSFFVGHRISYTPKENLRGTLTRLDPERMHAGALEQARLEIKKQQLAKAKEINDLSISSVPFELNKVDDAISLFFHLAPQYHEKLKAISKKTPCSDFRKRLQGYLEIWDSFEIKQYSQGGSRSRKRELII